MRHEPSLILMGKHSITVYVQIENLYVNVILSLGWAAVTEYVEDSHIIWVVHIYYLEALY